MAIRTTARAVTVVMSVAACLGAPARSEPPQPLLLLELFTSQGCYSCPPAEELLAERYLGREDLLALELHVDYWDDLVYRGSSWADPYSSPKFTERQYGYATAFRGPFTPQAIVQGSYSSSGTSRTQIDHALSEVKDIDLTAGWDVELTQDEDGSWTALVHSVSGEADAVAVVFLRQAVTEVTRGENKGETLTNHNIVISWDEQGLMSAGNEIKLGHSDESQGCALIVQRPDQGVVLGAWPCIRADQANSGSGG